PSLFSSVGRTFLSAIHVSLYSPLPLRGSTAFLPSRATPPFKNPRKTSPNFYFLSPAQHQRATCDSLTIWAYSHRQRRRSAPPQPLDARKQKRSDPPIAPRPLLNSEF